MTNLLTLPPSALAEYQEWLNIIKLRVSSARLRVALPTVEEIENDLLQLQQQAGEAE